jgi:hypothetical protein
MAHIHNVSSIKHEVLLAFKHSPTHVTVIDMFVNETHEKKSVLYSFQNTGNLTTKEPFKKKQTLSIATPLANAASKGSP